MSDSLAYLDEVLAERGLRLARGPNDTLQVVGPRIEVTEALRGMIAEHRAEIMARFPPPKRLRQWLWRPGQVSTEEPWWSYAEDFVPAGAWWWRYVGETSWRPVAGRNPEQIQPPNGHEVSREPSAAPAVSR